MLYFAYGSNLSHKQMLRRCPESKFVGRGLLRNYAMQFDGHSERWGGAVANIVLATGSSVTGGLYEISHKDLRLLDKFEGYPTRYTRVELAVNIGTLGTGKAIVYLRATPQAVGEPTAAYLKTIEDGRVDCGIIGAEAAI